MEAAMIRRSCQAQRPTRTLAVPRTARLRSAALRFTQPTFALLAALVAMPSMLAAQSGADFFNGKTVTYIVATASGGGYDAYGRLVSEFMQRHLPGSTFVVKNVPGAGHLIGANTIYAARADGLTIGTFNTGLIYGQLTGQAGVRFDLSRMTWIGKAGSDPRVLAIAAATPITTFAELRAAKAPLNFATSGIGSSNYVEITSLTNLLGLPVKLLTGYNGNEDQLAMRRGEVAGGLGARSSFESFVKNGYGRLIAQIGGRETDVPQLSGLVSEPRAKALVALIEQQTEVARLTAGPPGIPADRAEALRAAFRKAIEDPGLKERAERQGRPLEPAYGDDASKLVRRALDQPADLVASLREAMKPVGVAGKR